MIYQPSFGAFDNSLNFTVSCVKELFGAYEYPLPFAIKNTSDFII